MKRILLVGFLVFAGCSIEPNQPSVKTVARHKRKPKRPIAAVRPESPVEIPAVNPSLEARARNHSGGSCVYVSLETCLRWQNNDEVATALRANNSGGASQGALHAALRRLNVPFVFTSTGDVGFLDWSARTRRGAMIFYYPNHAVSLVDLTRSEAVLLDNNHVAEFIRIPREEFIRRWQAYGGVATTPLIGPPATPL